LLVRSLEQAPRESLAPQPVQTREMASGGMIQASAHPAPVDGSIESVIRALEGLQRSDPSRYVRVRSAAALREAIRLQPDFAGAHTTLAAVLRQLGDTSGAASESRAGAELAKQTTNLQAALFATNSGRRLRNAGDLTGAISQFRAAIQSVSDYAPAHFELAITLRQAGKKEEAAAEFHKAVALDPKLVAPSE